MKLWLATIENHEDMLINRVSAASIEEATSKVEALLESWDGWELLDITEEVIEFIAQVE